MIRRSAVAMIVLVGAWGLAHSQAPADVRSPSNEPRSITLSLNKTGMIEVPQSFRITTAPRATTAGRTVRLQVRSGSGFVTQRQLKANARGLAVGTVSSKRVVNRTYRAVLLSARGRVVAASPPVTVSWMPLQHSVNLSCAASSAPLRASVPCTMTVTPAVRLDRMVALLQVRGRTDWVLVEALRVPANGVVRSEVMGTEPGVANYRVLLVRDAKPVAESPSVAIAYAATD